MRESRLFEQIDEVAKLAILEASTLELLREGVDRDKPVRQLLSLRRIIHLGMGDGVSAIEEGRLAKDEVFLPEGIEVANDMQSLEPDKLDRPRAVGEVGHEALLAPLSELLVVTDVAAQLDAGELATQLTDLVSTRAVDVLGGEVEQEVLVGI